MTVVVSVESKPLEQITKQLNKLINVIKILEHDPGSAVERELMLLKVRAKGDARARIMEIAEVFRVLDRRRHEDDAHGGGFGEARKLEALRELLSEYGIVELLADRADRPVARRPGDP